MKYSTQIVLITCTILLASCANKTSVSREKVSRGDPLLDKYASNHGYAKVDGVVRSGSEKQSVYSNQEYSGSNDFSGKDYTTKDYASKRWSGSDSKYGAKSYSDNTIYDQAPDFVKQQAYYSGQKNSADSTNYGKSNFGVSNARETGVSGVKSKASTYAQRNNVKDPVIVPLKDQGILTDHQGVNGISVAESRALLGRSDGQ